MGKNQKYTGDLWQDIASAVSDSVRESVAEGVQRLQEQLHTAVTGSGEDSTGSAADGGSNAAGPKNAAGNNSAKPTAPHAFSQRSFSQQSGAPTNGTGTQPFSQRKFSQQTGGNAYRYDYDYRYAVKGAAQSAGSRWTGIAFGVAQSAKRILCDIGGGAAAVLGTIFTILSLSNLGNWGAVAGWAAGAVVAVWAALTAFGTAKRTRRFTAYLGILGTRTKCSVEELAVAVCRKPDYVRRDLQAMIRKGYFRAACLNAEGTVLYESGSAYMADLQTARTAPSGVPQEEGPAMTQGQQMNEECATFLRDLHAQRARVQDEAVCEQIDRIEQQTKSIYAWVEKHPRCITAVRRFSGYYLPTTLKLLRTYNDVDAQADGSTVAEQIQTDIVGILHTINKAFSSLQDSLLADTALDVSSEISALETVLAQEGLTEDELLLK